MTTMGIYWNSPWWFLLLLPLAVITYMVIKRNSKAYINVPGPVDGMLYRSWKTRLSPLLKYLILASLLAAIVGMAQPQKLYNEEKVKADALDIFLVMDLSSSMLAKDFAPDRISVSKQVAEDFVKGREYDRIGLVLFAGEAFTQNPLTLDKEVLLQNLRNSKVGMLSDGTFIGMGLATAVNRLANTESATKIVILLTDGVDNTTQSAGNVNPTTAMKLAESMGVKVYTIGIGSSGQVYRPVKRDFSGNYIFDYSTAEFDEELLKEIAAKTGGRYFRAGDEQALRDIYNEIDRLEKTPIEVNIYERKKELFPYFVIISLAFLGLYILLSQTVLKVVER